MHSCKTILLDKNSSKLPLCLHYLSDNCLSSVGLSQDRIAKIIQNIDPNKAHAHANISIYMLKICSSSIYKSSETKFKQCVETCVFPSEWKNTNIGPIHKKGDKQILENYRPVLLLLICGKIIERLLFNEMLNRTIVALISCYLSPMRYMNLLILDLKLEASSLIYQKHLIRCDIQKKSKWNIVKFTKPSGRFFKGKKTTRSPQQASLYMEKCQYWSTSRFHPWSFVVFDLH